MSDDPEEIAELDALIETFSRGAAAAMNSPSGTTLMMMTADQLFCALAWLVVARSSDDEDEALEIEILFPLDGDEN